MGGNFFRCHKIFAKARLTVSGDEKVEEELKMKEKLVVEVMDEAHGKIQRS